MKVILIVYCQKRHSERQIERNREVRRCIKTYPQNGLDIFVFTPLDITARLKSSFNIGKEAVTTGKLLYERV